MRDDETAPEQLARPPQTLPWEQPTPPAPVAETPAWAPSPPPAPWAGGAMAERPGQAAGWGPPANPTAVYRYRRSVLEGERTYALDGHALWVLEDGRLPIRVPYEEVRQVRLDDVGGRAVRHFECGVTTTRGSVVKLRHQTFLGFADFRDQRLTYTPFVSRLLTELSGHPQVRFRTGSLARFLGGWAMMALIALLAVWMVSIEAWGVVTVMAFGLLVMLVHTLLARPRDFSPLAPPTRFLPF